MKCPTDETTLVMSERSGIEIDYCPTCRGVWLDRGELDKIIERSVTESAPRQNTGGQNMGGQNMDGQNSFPMPYQDRGGHSDRGHDQYGRRRKKEGWLGELFG